jgi:hypothetical protein
MSGSVESAVAAATNLQNLAQAQDTNNTLLRETLNSQASTIMSLISGATQDTSSLEPQLASFGMVGTQLHTTA